MDKLIPLIKKYYNKIVFVPWWHCDERRGAPNCVVCARGDFYARRLNNRKINYKCEQKRFLYIVRYMPLRILQILEMLRQMDEPMQQFLQNQARINVISLGAGPGFDIAAIQKYLVEQNINNVQKNVTCWRVDKEQLWDQIAVDVINIYESDSVHFEHNCWTFDFSNPIPPFSGSVQSDDFNIIIASYFLSELDENSLANVFSLIKENTLGPSLIMINDINDSNGDVKNILINLRDFLGSDYKWKYDDNGIVGKNEVRRDYPYPRDFGKAEPYFTCWKSKTIRVLITKIT